MSTFTQTIQKLSDEHLKEEVAAFTGLVLKEERPAFRASLLESLIPLCLEWKDRLWREALHQPTRKEEQAAERKWLDERERKYQESLRNKKSPRQAAKG